MSLKYLTIICVIFIIISDTGGYFHSEESSTDDRQCFCEVYYLNNKKSATITKIFNLIYS